MRCPALWAGLILAGSGGFENIFVLCHNRSDNWACYYQNYRQVAFNRRMCCEVVHSCAKVLEWVFSYSFATLQMTNCLAAVNVGGAIQEGCCMAHQKPKRGLAPWWELTLPQTARAHVLSHIYSEQLSSMSPVNGWGSMLVHEL